jgi:hypothetical protein
MIYIFNRNWVDTRWQQYITHLHTNNTQNTEKGEFGKCEPCPVFASYTLAFASQLRKKHRKTSVRVASVVEYFYLYTYEPIIPLPYPDPLVIFECKHVKYILTESNFNGMPMKIPFMYAFYTGMNKEMPVVI